MATTDLTDELPGFPALRGSRAQCVKFVEAERQRERERERERVTERERWRPVFFNEMKRGLKRQSDGERERV